MGLSLRILVLLCLIVVIYLPQLQEMHFVRQPSSTCNFRANTILLPALWMLGMLTKRQTLKGRFTIAAKHHITIAEIYETELVDIEKVSSGFSFSYT